MNKCLMIIKILLLILVCFLNIYSYSNLVNFGHLLFLILLFIIVVLTIKDIIKKNPINNNRMYTFIFILSFLIISYVFYRFGFDKSLFFNKYTSNLYGGDFSEFKMLYLGQNTIYFNTMLILLLVFRKINGKSN